MNNRPFQQAPMAPPSPVGYAMNPNASMLDQYVVPPPSIGLASQPVRPKTNSEWIEAVEELAQRAADEVVARETTARLAFLHSQIMQQRAGTGEADPAVLEEYSVLAG